LRKRIINTRKPDPGLHTGIKNPDDSPRYQRDAEAILFVNGARGEKTKTSEKREMKGPEEKKRGHSQRVQG